MDIVSLVPSVTETLRALGADPVACTRFCEQPDLPTVGGTKNPDVGAIVALQPDLVIVNDEENRAEDADALVASGLRVHSMSPRSVADVGPAMVALCGELGMEPPRPFAPGEWETWLDSQRPFGCRDGRGAVVLIWRRPWMTLNAETYGSSLLEVLGIANLFADAESRYPEVTIEQIAARRPDLVLLPGEPYPFNERHAAEVAEAIGAADVRLVDGQDLFWWGVRTPAAVSRLQAALLTVRRVHRS